MIPIAKPWIGEEEKKAVAEVLDSGMIAQGPRVKQLEEEFATIAGTKYAVATNNGTSALHTALHAMGIKPGDEVITVPFTFVATANSILMQNAKPVFVDIDEKTYCIDVEKVKEAITPNTKAIIPVDLYGQIFDYRALREIANDHNLKILEDAAQSIGASAHGKNAGSCGDCATFSLYATKNIVSGEGGMITTDNEEYARRAQQFRHHGQGPDARYFYHEIGYNYRLTDIQAAIASVQLKRLEEFTNARIAHAKTLTESLSKLPWLQTPHVKQDHRHVFHQYTIRVLDKLSRDDLIVKLKEAGIGCGVFYPKPLHLFKTFSQFGYQEGQFPITEQIAQQVVSLPVHPQVTEENLKYITEFFSSL